MPSDNVVKDPDRPGGDASATLGLKNVIIIFHVYAFSDLTLFY